MLHLDTKAGVHCYHNLVPALLISNLQDELGLVKGTNRSHKMLHSLVLGCNY
jgi:hypothetical protein